MQKRKSNRLKGYDYSKNNLYFITNCVKDRICCLGQVIPAVGTGRDLSETNPNKNTFQSSDLSETNPNKNTFQSSDLSETNPNKNTLQWSDLSVYNPQIEYTVKLNQYGNIIAEKINWLSEQYAYVIIHNYVIMPNHFHLILEIDSNKVIGKEIKIKTISSLIGALKTTTSKLIHEAGLINFAWHRSFHDHIIRNETSYNNIYNYIDNNPQKWHQDTFFENH